MIGLGYLPHVLATGREVIGYLPGYLHEEGYDSGTRSMLLSAVFPDTAAKIVGALVLVAVAVWAWRRSDPAAPEQTATVLTGVAFLVVTPSYGWYAPMLIALAVLSSRYEWVLVALAPSLVYLVRGELTHDAGPSALIFAGAALGTLAWWYLRAVRPARTTRTPATSPAGAPYPPPESCSARPDSDRRSRTSA